MSTKTIKCYVESCPNTVEISEEDLAKVSPEEAVVCSECFEYLANKIAELSEGGTVH